MAAKIFNAEEVIIKISFIELIKAYRKKLLLLLISIGFSLIAYFTITFKIIGGWEIFKLSFILWLLCLIPLFTIVIFPILNNLIILLFKIVEIFTYALTGLFYFIIEKLNDLNNVTDFKK